MSEEEVVIFSIPGKDRPADAAGNGHIGHRRRGADHRRQYPLGNKRQISGIGDREMEAELISPPSRVTTSPPRRMPYSRFTTRIRTMTSVG